MKISIQREGNFAIGWEHSHNHQCGNVGLNVLRYRVEIWANHDQLSHDGYILDNNDIPKYFDKKYRDVTDFVSCEKICMFAVREFMQKFGTDKNYYAESITRIKVSIQGISDSWISAEWVA